MRKLITSLIFATLFATSVPTQAKDVKCLTEMLYYETRGQKSDSCKLKTAHVVFNRVNDKRFPKTACGVIHQRSQFSWTANKKRRVNEIREWNEANKLATKIIAQHNSGTRVDTTGNALYFTTGRVFRGTKITSRCEGHIFMKENRI